MRLFYVVTVGHLAIGLAAGRTQSPRGRIGVHRLLVFAALSALPDADLIVQVLFHPAYAMLLGHRGLTHSLSFAALVALAAAALAPNLSATGSRLKTSALAFAVVASHGVLDPLVEGSSGTRLWWPFSLTRFAWGSFKPLPDAIVSARPYVHFGHLAFELLLSSPLLAYAFWPPRRRAPLRRQSSSASRVSVCDVEETLGSLLIPAGPNLARIAARDSSWTGAPSASPTAPPSETASAAAPAITIASVADLLREDVRDLDPDAPGLLVHG